MKSIVAATLALATLMPGGASIGSETPDDPPAPPRVMYSRNTDYSQPATAETLLWISCMLDHGNWPKRNEVAISRTGLSIALMWDTPESARLVPMRLEPFQVKQLFHTVEHQIKLREIDSKASRKDEPYALYCHFMHARPHRWGGGVAVYASDVAQIGSWLDTLRGFLDRARAASRSEPGDGPRTIADIVTQDPSFLPHFLSIMHVNDAMTPVTGERQDRKSPQE